MTLWCILRFWIVCCRTKLKQTEVDCEFLKKCCETLTDENRRLKKELQELKALKLAQPLYMPMPAATLTMCPSCERLGGVSDNGSNKSPFSMAPKPHFYNPFANPSAACWLLWLGFHSSIKKTRVISHNHCIFLVEGDASSQGKLSCN